MWLKNLVGHIWTKPNTSTAFYTVAQWYFQQLETWKVAFQSLMRQALLISFGCSKTAWTNWPNTRSMKPSPRGNISCRKAMCPPWAVSNRATLGRSWTVFSGNAVRWKEEKYRLKRGWGNLQNPGEEQVTSITVCILLHLTHYDEERRGHLQHWGTG